MPKRKALQAEESHTSTTKKPKSKTKTKPKRKVVKKSRKIQIGWSQLFRLSIMLILVGVIVFHYYLITEQALLSYYQSIWNNHKQTLSPILVIVGYSTFVFLIGFWVGKKRK